jgi:chromosome segregation ATPase
MRSLVSWSACNVPSQKTCGLARHLKNDNLSMVQSTTCCSLQIHSSFCLLQSLIEAAEAERAAAQDDVRMARQQLQSQTARVEQLTAQLDRCAFDMQQLKQSCEDAENARDDAQRERDGAVKAREEAEERARVLGSNLEECERTLRERDAREGERMEVARREKEEMGLEIERMRVAKEQTMGELERERQEGKGLARALNEEKLLVQV